MDGIRYRETIKADSSSLWIDNGVINNQQILKNGAKMNLYGTINNPLKMIKQLLI